MTLPATEARYAHVGAEGVRGGVHCIGRIVAAICLLAAVPSYAPGQTSLPSDATSELRNLVPKGVLDELHWPEFPAYVAQVASFYGASNYMLAWTRNGRPTIQAHGIIEALKTADRKGLDPKDYDGPRWSLHLSTLDQPGISPRALARFDLALTISVMRYVSDLHIGKVNPHLFHFGFDVAEKEYDLAGLLRQRLIDARDAQLALHDVEPPFDGYRRTREALQSYITLAGRDNRETLPSPDKPLEPGGSYKGIPMLVHLLRALGDLPAEIVLSPDSDVYEGVIVEAVRHFQIRHGLDPDGRIGARTLQQLNTPLTRRVRQLQLTLERWRWVPHQFLSPPIVVNIPEFVLRAVNDSYLTEFAMKVIVGKAYRHRTPVFAAELKHVIFQPYWNVPLNIQRAELLPALARNRSYGAYSDFQIVTPAGKVVSERALTDTLLSQLRTGKLHLRQLPGPRNALGRVKFIFPNDQDVYMHDTPARHLFSKPRRDFSHGCIRVENPQALAEWVLRNNPEWSPERIGAAMNGTATIKAIVKQAIPVLIVYATAVVLQGGEVRFFDDIYGHDALLETQLARAHP